MCNWCSRCDGEAEKFQRLVGRWRTAVRACLDVIMTSAKRDVAASRLTSLLHEWDSGSKSVRRRILQEFVAENQRKTAPQLDAEFADAASLFFTRLTSWLRLTYPSVTSMHRSVYV